MKPPQSQPLARAHTNWADPHILAVTLLSLALAAIVMADLWAPLRAAATLVLGFFLPGYLLSFAVFPRDAPDGLRLVVTIVGSLAVTMTTGFVLAGLFSFTRLGIGLCWGVATVVFSALALARLARDSPSAGAAI